MVPDDCLASLLAAGILPTSYMFFGRYLLESPVTRVMGRPEPCPWQGVWGRQPPIGGAPQNAVGVWGAAIAQRDRQLPLILRGGWATRTAGPQTGLGGLALSRCWPQAGCRRTKT